MIDEFLKAAGYGEQVKDPVYGKDGVVYWYKKVPETVHHQVVVRMWPAVGQVAEPTFDVEMTYETRNEIWAQTRFYGLAEEDLVEELHRLEGCMKQALLYMDANPIHYQFKGSN